MRLFVWLPLLLAACTGDGDESDESSSVLVSGRVEDASLDEISGLARSHLAADLLWAVNDDGAARIHAFDTAGRKRGHVAIEGARNRDWEDIASFRLQGDAYLLVADIGDNDARHQELSLYVLPEPAPADDEVEVAWRIDFSYPDGPRDAEAVAVDAAAGQVYLLSKRDVPARLYRLPLRPDAGENTVAVRLGDIGSLPQPSGRELRQAGGSGYHWQPTAMDFAADGSAVLILTYAGVNFFTRGGQQSWLEAMQGQAMQLRLSRYPHAESVAFAHDGRHAWVTLEGRNAPLLRIDLASARH